MVIRKYFFHYRSMVNAFSQTLYFTIILCKRGIYIILWKMTKRYHSHFWITFIVGFNWNNEKRQWILKRYSTSLKWHIFLFFFPFLYHTLVTAKDWNVGFFDWNIGKISNIGGRRNNNGHQLFSRQEFWKKISKIIEILAKYRFKCDIWTKKLSMGQRVAARKDSTKNYRFIGDFLKVFFF